MASASRLTSLGATLLLLLVVAPASGAAPEADAPISLREGWRFRWGDAPLGTNGLPTWATEPGTSGDWRPVPALKPPPEHGNHTFLWLSIPVPAGRWEKPALFLGEAASAVEVYALGRRIYASGELVPTGREVPETMGWHLVPLPREALGGRVLLRIQSSTPNIGVGVDARVGEHHVLLAETLRAGQAQLIMSVLLFAVAAVAGGAFALQWRRRMLVGLTVFAASGGMILLGVSGTFTALWEAPGAGLVAMTVGIFLVEAGLMEFIADALVDRRLRWFQWGTVAVWALSLLCSLAALVDTRTGQRLLFLHMPLSLGTMLLCVGMSLREAWRGNPEARIFVGGLGAFFLSVLLTVLPVLGAVKTSLGNVTHWGYLALTVSIVGVVARRSLQVVRSLSEYTHQLEARQKEVRHLAERMGNGAGELATVAEQLRASSDAQSSGVSRQAVALQQADQTVQEIRRASQLTAEKAEALAASAEGAEAVGREGAAAVERTLADLAAIRTEVSEMASRILAVDARTREVSGIVDAVKALADQSNMLAINAAIEAVRSGDSGKGFGVVAREMRSLADQSIQATQRIRDVLDGVSASMREAAKVSELGEQRVRGSVEAVRTSGAQLQKLAAIIGETSSSVRQITAAVSAQDAGTRQMAQAIQELSAQMLETLKSVQEAQDATRSVHSLAESMEGMAAQTLRAEEWTPPAATAGP